MAYWHPWGIKDSCPYCDGRDFQAGPWGGAAHMYRCLNCAAEFLHSPTWKILMDNAVFTRCEDGARRSRQAESDRDGREIREREPGSSEPLH